MSYLNFWPFNTAAKRREAEQLEKERKAAHEREYRALINKTRTVKSPRTAPHSTLTSIRNTTLARRDDSAADPLNPLSPLNPLNPLNPLSPVSVFHPQFA